MADTIVKPEVLDPDTGEPLKAHYVKKDDQMRGYLGEEVEALCGKRWVPSRDYKGLPLCEVCKARAEQVKASVSN